MRRTSCFVIALMLAMGAASAFGQDCKPLQLNFTLPDIPLEPGDDLYDDYVPLIETRFGIEPGTFEWCWTQRIIGTIPGTWIACGKTDLGIFDPFGFGVDTELWGNPGILVTKRGYLFTMSYGVTKWADLENLEALGGVTYYEGATGRWEGRIGWGTDSPQHYPPSYWIRSDGLLCKPAAALSGDEARAQMK